MICGSDGIGHQTRLHPAARTGWETRLALTQQRDINRAMGEPIDRWSIPRGDWVAGGCLLKYMLFTDEAVLTEPVSGTSGFQKEFPLRIIEAIHCDLT
jgi:hypothetical protein